MNRMQTRLPLWIILSCLGWGLFAANLPVKSQETSPSQQTGSPSNQEQKSKKQTAAQSDASADATASGKKSSSRTAGQGSASAEEIAAAKASNKVWVNLDSGIYHRSGRWYGKTKNGKFMSLGEAKQAGYRESKRQ
jgi:cytoskeletal protein RodZ